MVLNTTFNNILVISSLDLNHIYMDYIRYTYNSICSQDIICTTANKCETYASFIHDICLKTEYYA
jgi:hypothetical protein